ERLRRALTGYPQRFTLGIHPRGRTKLEVDMTFVPLLSGGNVGGIYVVAKDMTEQLAAAEQLKQSGRQLQQSVKMEAVGRLAGGIAHDFNNLLTAIRGYTDLLVADPSVAGPARADLLEISRAVDRATSLTRQLLAFSRQQVVHRRVVDLNVVVDEVRSMLSRLFRADTEIVVRVQPDPLWVLADPAQIHQILMNLVVNAQDAMPGGGRLTIETGRRLGASYEADALTHLDGGSYAVLSVSDTGRGMDQETQAHIFEPFFTTKPPGQGTGLGLSTVYAIVEQSGARIGFRSAPERGTEFTIYFPEQPDGAVYDGREDGRHAVRCGSETVLVAEDDESVRRMVRKILSNAGYTVLEARHGADALLVSREHAGPIDLLLTDVVMPELNGLRLAHVLKQERPETAVIFMSGYARDEVDRQGLTEPGVLFIHKPFTVAELSEAVRTALDPAQG
ncbi:MAG: ATP-binding protein, partial [Gemmatimonadales bacterium]